MLAVAGCGWDVGDCVGSSWTAWVLCAEDTVDRFDWVGCSGLLNSLLLAECEEETVVRVDEVVVLLSPSLSLVFFFLSSEPKLGIEAVGEGGQAGR